MELTCHSFDNSLPSREENTPPSTFSRNACAALSNDSLYQLYQPLCQTGILKCFILLVIEEVKKMTNSCPICYECKPRYHHLDESHLIKVTQPFEWFQRHFPLVILRTCIFSTSSMSTLASYLLHQTLSRDWTEHSARTWPYYKTGTNLLSTFTEPEYVGPHPICRENTCDTKLVFVVPGLSKWERTWTLYWTHPLYSFYCPLYSFYCSPLSLSAHALF